MVKVDLIHFCIFDLNDREALLRIDASVEESGVTP